MLVLVAFSFVSSMLEVNILYILSISVSPYLSHVHKLVMLQCLNLSFLLLFLSFIF